MSPGAERRPDSMDRIQIVRDCYAAFARGDREAFERHLGDDFTFSAPPDVGIDKATWRERCWPAQRTVERFDYARLVEVGDEVLVTYEATRPNGTRFRNTEILGFEGEKLTSVEVYFGWEVA
jgi:ketosteroid isomerase-like protein